MSVFKPFPLPKRAILQFGRQMDGCCSGIMIKLACEQGAWLGHHTQESLHKLLRPVRVSNPMFSFSVSAPSDLGASNP